jgi:glycosyltransferase involved in cell wall biosynthesis
MIRIAIDGNEANVQNRVGSNTYAFAIISELYTLSANRKNIDITILLSSKRVADLPPVRNNWRYMVIGPKKFWTQWALPIHLFLHQKDYQVFFTPSHYAPRISSIPYVSSVMDLAYLHYPEQFRENDLLQLKNWTKYSVKHARKIITISKFSKKEIEKYYQRQSKDILIAYPSFQFTESAPLEEIKNFFKEKQIKNKYFLYLGTLQPRKNITSVIAAYEEFLRKLAASNLKAKNRQVRKVTEPDLVIAGKIGWLADNILARIANSPVKEKIILTGFVEDKFKRALYQNATASLLLSLYEGFGIPALESMQAGTIPIVANNSSLPEVVAKAGFLVDAKNTHQVSDAMLASYQMPYKELLKYKTAMRRQAKKFDWQESAKIILKVLEHEK